jgi:hypothetical protein
MKVYIGNYPNRLTCRIHTRYMDRKYGYIDWPTEQSRFENFLEKLEDFVQTCYTPINYFLDKREQKVKIHIDRWDTWSMDHTLAPIILPMLKQLKENKHGAPHVDMEDVPKELRATKAQQNKYAKLGEVDPKHFERWDWVMDEMIYAFEQKTLDNWEEQYYGKWVEDESKLFGGYHINADDEGRKAHQERISNGFRLFGKYYEALWD